MEPVVKYEILKSGVSRYNPYVHDMEAAGAHISLYFVLNEVFKREREVYAGSIEQVMEGMATAMPKHRAEKAFQELERYGYLTLSGDVFTPTEKYLEIFS